MQVNLEEHLDVKTYLNEKKPSVTTIAKAYLARDNIMKLNFNNLKEEHLKKLGYTDESIQQNINHKLKGHLYSLVNHFLKQPIIENAEHNFLDEYNKFMSSEDTVTYIESKKKEYKSLSIISDHLQFYQSLTKDELMYLGW